MILEILLLLAVVGLFLCPLLATIVGRFLPGRWTPMVLLALSIGFGISAFYSLDMVPRKHRELLAYPALICAGLCIGSLEGLSSRTGRKRNSTDALKWANRASVAERMSNLTTFLACSERAGDCYRQASMYDEALVHYRAAWGRQTLACGVHPCMDILAGKLASVMRTLGLKAEAAAVEAQLEEARQEEADE